MPSVRLGNLVLVCGFVAVAIFARGASANAGVPEKGGGWVAFAYDYAHLQYHLDADGKKVDIGSMNHQRLLAQVEYGVTDHLAVSASLPYIQAQYTGSHPHTITTPDGVVHVSQTDDGSYHGSFQDVVVIAKYQMNAGQWLVTPMVEYGRPTHGYPAFTHGAIGTNQNKASVGVMTGRGLPEPFDRFYVELDYLYSFMEQYEGTTANKSVAKIELDYFATDRLMLRLYTIAGDTHNGVGPSDFKTNPELFEHHEQIQRSDSVDVGVGANFVTTATTSVFGSILRTTWGENLHKTEYDVTIGFSVAF